MKKFLLSALSVMSLVAASELSAAAVAGTATVGTGREQVVTVGSQGGRVVHTVNCPVRGANLNCGYDEQCVMIRYPRCPQTIVTPAKFCPAKLIPAQFTPECTRQVCPPCPQAPVCATKCATPCAKPCAKKRCGWRRGCRRGGCAAAA